MQNCDFVRGALSDKDKGRNVSGSIYANKYDVTLSKATIVDLMDFFWGGGDAKDFL
jgi:hypothetical protein